MKKTSLGKEVKWIFVVPVLVIILFLFVPAEGQEKYPTRPIEVIVPFGPGGATDLTTRVMAVYAAKKFGVPVNVVNKPGGNTVPACLEVYQAKPDGYTLLGDSLPSASMVGVVVKSLPFKVMDRTFIGSASCHPLVIMVPVNSPLKSMKDIENAAKSSPETFTWISMGGAGQQDLAMRQFFKAIGVDILKTKPVMAQSGAKGAALIGGGHVLMGSSATGSAIPVIKAGHVRPLAITSKERFPDLPEVPTTAEAGYSSVNAIQWNGPSGPPNLPSYVVEVWNKVLQDMVRDPEVITHLRNVGALPFYLNARDIREYAGREIAEIDKLWAVK
jgi:tripartite-type tricarboxylate transporter receptor subunit TctC